MNLTTYSLRLSPSSFHFCLPHRCSPPTLYHTPHSLPLSILCSRPPPLKPRHADPSGPAGHHRQPYHGPAGQYLKPRHADPSGPVGHHRQPYHGPAGQYRSPCDFLAKPLRLEEAGRGESFRPYRQLLASVGPQSLPGVVDFLLWQFGPTAVLDLVGKAGRVQHGPQVECHRLHFVGDCNFLRLEAPNLPSFCAFRSSDPGTPTSSKLQELL